MKLLFANTLNLVWIIGMVDTLIVHIGSLFASSSFNGGPLSSMLTPVLLAYVFGFLFRVGEVLGPTLGLIFKGLRDKPFFTIPQPWRTRNLPARVIKIDSILGWYNAALLFVFIGSLWRGVDSLNRIFIWLLAGAAFSIYWFLWIRTYEWQRNLKADSERSDQLAGV